MNRQTDDIKSFRELERLLIQIEANGLKSLSGNDVLEFGHLYRRTASALSNARGQGVNDRHIEYLNQLVTRAYGHIYTVESKGWPSVRTFFTKDFPQSFRKNLQFISIAFLITIIGALFAFGVVKSDPGKADIVLGPGSSSMVDSIAQRHTGHQNWMPEEERPVMSSFIMTNNLRVAGMAFASGIFWGIFTLGVMFYNGLMLGVVGAVVMSRGPAVALSFWAFVAPHGVIELTAIFIAGGAGLMLGWSLLNPGIHTRAVALKLAGREAFKLMAGVAVMLVIAGLIEGFFSPSMTPEALKLAIASMLGVSLYSYLFLVGREK